MSPVRRHFWQVVARVNSSLHLPRKWSLNWFMPAGVNSTDGSQRGTSTSLGRRTQPLDSKKARYFSRISSVFMRWRPVFSRQFTTETRSGSVQMKVVLGQTDYHIGPILDRLGGESRGSRCG